MRRIRLKAVTLAGTIVATLLTLLMLIVSASAPQVPRVYVTFLGHTNGPDGIGLNTFSISNSSPFRVDRRACFMIFDAVDVPQEAVAGLYKVLNPHETELFDIEDVPNAMPRWRLKVACVAVEEDAHWFLKKMTDQGRDVGIPAPRLESPHEFYFLSGWTKP